MGQFNHSHSKAGTLTLQENQQSNGSAKPNAFKGANDLAKLGHSQFTQPFLSTNTKFNCNAIGAITL
ncbi:hypothetical protein HYG93_07795 [Acinetobacter sp. SwsAc6]|uniref:Uncharacterized protein n=1 Tax=Acinetobacter cumulans TaxID=2136182 RepID=A0A498DB53_9GAMM|nr:MULTISPECIES: hypothetical protein [Acinetobacter]NWK74193.1 hypothetical protein [Acinetobacter sp. SwsAc6]QCO22221.1 hypothetical protein C9E88_012385 [Acinetobacter cumulans]RFS30987.1 hypothetical protein DYI81_09210 [Acinetobacter sp. SWAC5]RKG46805.1 hypothetical protein D7V51_01105 [Acinetobacter cumulans]RKG49707.1 hypothetical protein D7V68_05640 [Acinetobacter cumulans]